MKSRRFLKSKNNRRKQKGIALIVMLLLLLLLSALSITMVMAFSSDTLTSGFYRNSRAAFYAADAGNTIVRQDIVSRFNALLPTTLTVGTYPLSATAATNIASAVNAAYGNWVSINSDGAFAESFKLYTGNTSLTLYSCTVGYYTDATQATKLSATNTATSLTSSVTCPSYTYAYTYTYTYHYSLTTLGMVSNTGGTAVTDSGNIIVNATSADSLNNPSQFGTFIDKQTICSAELIGGTITGPQFTNGGWTFGYDQSYNFSGVVGSHGANAGYKFSDGTCNQVAGSKSTYKNVTISPTFQKGLELGQDSITLPTDEYNQKSAVITGKGANADGSSVADPSTPELSAALKDSSGNYSYTGATTSGVFAPVSSTGSISGGGISVEGNASVSLSYSGTTAQIYTITQGSTVTTVTITSNGTVGGGTTKLKTGTNAAVTYTGVPTQTDPTTGTVTNGVLLYVDGNVTSVSGTVQDNTGVTVTAANDITVTGNLVYKTAVVDSSGNETTAASNGTATQALGLYTSGGSVYLKPSTSGGDLEIDASILTTKDNGGDCNYGSSCDGVLGVANNSKVGTLKIVGGRVQSRAQIMPSGTLKTRNVIFDQRYNGTFAPPFFPKLKEVLNPPSYSTTIQRTGWVLQTAY